jgi:hypothetical protein
MTFLAQSGCQLCRPAQLRIDTFADGVGIAQGKERGRHVRN